MSTRRPKPSSATLPKLLLACLIVAVIGLCFYGASNSLGWFQSNVVSSPNRDNKTKVPVTLRDMKAFSEVLRDDIYDLGLGEDSFQWVETAKVDPDWILDMSKIRNRVLACDKEKDYPFTESDFLPEGSRTGIIGGVAEGKQGFFLDVEKIPGLRFLRQGDRFDLIASVPKSSQDSTTEYGLLMGGIKVRGNKPIPVNGIRQLVKGGEMIAITTNRLMTTQGGLELGPNEGSVRSRSYQQNRFERVAIAIDPEEAIPLTQALGDQLEIHMVAQSGQVASLESTKINLNNLVSFPANAVEIKAFTKIEASHLADPLSNELRRYYFQPRDVNDSWLPNASDLIGKTVSRDIEPGYIFSSSDFLPEGSLLKSLEKNQVITASDLVGMYNSPWVGRYTNRSLEKGYPVNEEDLLPINSALKQISPFQKLEIADLVDGSRSPWLGRVSSREIGIGRVIDESLLCEKGSRPSVSSGIPAGMMAVSVNSDSIKGLEDLVMGDRVDLIESRIFELKKSLVGIEISRALLASENQKAYNQVVANNALVVRKQDGQSVLAVRLDDVNRLSKSLFLNAELVAIARPDKVRSSGDVDEVINRDQSNKLKSDSYPLSNLTVTELIVGGQKTAKAFRRDNDE